MGNLALKTGLHKQEQLGLSINPEAGGEPPPARKRSKALLRCCSGAGSKPRARRHLVPSSRTTNEKLGRLPKKKRKAQRAYLPDTSGCLLPGLSPKVCLHHREQRPSDDRKAQLAWGAREMQRIEAGEEPTLH